jgi:hypothetical protein
MRSEQTDALSAALAKAQASMRAATFNRINPHFKNKYADLASVLDAVRKPLADNGLSITQTTEIRQGAFVLVTTLWHSSGQWLSSEYPLPIAAKPQDLGSALTYARRYSLSAIACIAADEDDDAEGARKNGQIASTPDEYIMEDQFDSLMALAHDVRADMDKFCKYLGVVDLQHLPASRYADAVRALEAKGKAPQVKQ